MAQQTVCDLCLKLIDGAITIVTARTSKGNTPMSEVALFEFHPACYNRLQQMIADSRPAEPAPITPQVSTPVPQPGEI